MNEEHSHCSYCGGKFIASAPWPRTCPACHRTSYRNPLPVVVTLLPIDAGLVVIRRNIKPSKGTLTLPGGYLDIGESWQEGARRELWEETGIAIAASEMTLYDVQNGLDDTLVIFGLSAPQRKSCSSKRRSSSASPCTPAWSRDILPICGADPATGPGSGYS